MAQGVSVLGDLLATTALVLQLQEWGASGTLVALVLAAAVLPEVVLVPVVGRLVDRVDSRVLLTVTGVAQAICCAGMAFVHATWALVALVGVLGVGLAVTMPVCGALLPAMAGADGVGRAMAIGQTANAVGALGGPALAGLLAGAFGLRVPLLIDAATYLAVAAAGLLFRTRRRGARQSPAVARGGGWRIRDDRLLAAAVALVGALVLALNVELVVNVFFVRGTLGGSSFEYGLVDAAWMAGILLGGWVGAARAAGDAVLARVLAVVFLGTALTVLAAGFTSRIWQLYPIWLLGGLCNGVDNTILGVLAARRVPEAVRGAFFSRFGAVVNGANLGGFAAGGLLVDRFDPRYVIIGCGIAGVLAAAGFGVPLVRASLSAGSAAASSPRGTSSSRSPSPASSGSGP